MRTLGWRTDGIAVLAITATLATVARAPVASAQAAGSQRAVLTAKSGQAPRGAQPVVLTIEGGGSLGVYEAGMTWMLVELVKRQRSDDSTQRIPGLTQLSLQAVSGASAGSINALLAATSWCMKNAGGAPETSMFWQTWVPTGLQELVPHYNTSEWKTSGGLFSRQYFEKQVFRILKERWESAEWMDAGTCVVPVGATVTRLVPEAIPVPHATGVAARSQRFAATFDVMTVDAGGGRSKLALRLHQARQANPMSIYLPSVDGTIRPDDALRVFEASSGYPLAFEPFVLQNTGDTTSQAQYSDGGVFDNGPLGLGFELYFGSPYWAAELVKGGAKAFPIGVYVAPDSRRAWSDQRREEQPDVANSPRLIDPQARGLEAVLRLAAGFYPSARTYELQQTIRTLEGIDQLRGSESTDNPLRVLITSRWHPIVGDWMFGFAGFLGRPFREYDFYVGMYDGLALIAREMCRSAGTAGDAMERCVKDRLHEFVTNPVVNYGPVAPAVLRSLWQHEFSPRHDTTIVAATAAVGVEQAGAPSNPDTAVALALVRGMSAIMQDTSRAGRKAATANRTCDDTGMLSAVLCAEGFMSVIDTVNADAAASKALQKWLADGGPACDKNAVYDVSYTCRADARLIHLLQNPTVETDRTVQLLIERLLASTPIGHLSYKMVAGLGYAYFSGNESYRRRLDMGPTSLPPQHKSFEAIRWRLIPSSVTSSLGVPGALVGSEVRLNMTSKLGLVAPLRIALGQAASGDISKSGIKGWAVYRDFSAAPVVGLDLEWRLGVLSTTLRPGVNYWVDPVRDTIGFFARQRVSPQISALFLGGKFRAALARRPSGSIVNRRNPWLGELGVGDVNGLWYWARQLLAGPERRATTPPE